MNVRHTLCEHLSNKDMALTVVACQPAHDVQIQTCKQHAVGIVYSYPWIPAKHKMLEVLAAQRGEPPLQRFLDGDGLEDLQHAANWLQIADYLRTIDSSNLLMHVPLAGSKETCKKPTQTPPAFPKTSFDLLV